MRQIIKKWGNSLAVRIPASVADAARLFEDQEVEVTVSREGRIVVESTETADDFDFNVFVASIQKDDIPELIEIGEPVGRELGGPDDPYDGQERRPSRADVK